MIFNMSETNSGGGGEWVDITDQIVPTSCTPLEDFKAYLINNNLVMFGSFEVPVDYDSPLITIPQSFNYVVGGQKNSAPYVISEEYSGENMAFTTLEDSTEIYFNIEVIDIEYPVYISIYATNMEV